MPFGPFVRSPAFPFEIHPSAMFIYVNESSLKKMKNAFYSILKVLFVLKIFKFLSFLSCRKNSFIKEVSLISKLRRHNQVNKQLQYTYCAIFREVKATWQ